MTGAEMFTPTSDLVRLYPKVSIAAHIFQVGVLAVVLLLPHLRPDPIIAQISAERARSDELSADLLKARGQLADTQTVNTRLQDKNSGLDQENHKLAGQVNEAQQTTDGHQAHITALEKRVGELESMLGQTRPATIARVSLRKDAETKLSYGITLQYKGSSDDHIDVMYDGSRRLGIPRAGFTQAFPLRYVDSVGAYLGIVPIVLLDKERTLEAALVKFPAAWTFAPDK